LNKKHNGRDEKFKMQINLKPEIKSFSSSAEFRTWLSKNYDLQEGIWLKLLKKKSGSTTFSHADALDEALCYGWIDGVGKKYDDESWIIKFTPRREKSIWSKRNKENVARLIKTNRMTEHGLREVERAKADGRWDAAYDSPKEMKMPKDFMDELKKDKEAYDFFKTLNKTNTYAIAWRLQTAKKPETREKRKKILLDKMKNKEKLY
jgi:uncharacterized protein YdeI (YjbR/CyaY-like superfamily)